MDKINEKAQKNLPVLCNWIKELLALIEKMLKDKIEYDPNDNFAFMLLSFICKQEAHMKTILVLVENDYDRDAELIARSMIEGLFQILWTEKEDTETRSLQWRAFAWICDWRLMNYKIKKGEVVEQTTCDKIKHGIDLYGEEFLTDKAKDERNRKEALPEDPYRPYWHKCHIAQIAESIQTEVLYKELYKLFCAWHHWSPGGLGQAINRDENVISYCPSSIQSSATALAVGFQCLFETVIITNKHLKLGFDIKIQEIFDGYVKQLTENPSQI